MAALNIRNFPAELMRTLKTRAAARGVTLREYVVHALEAPAEAPPHVGVIPSSPARDPRE